jgi:hypothetical protein
MTVNQTLWHASVKFISAAATMDNRHKSRLYAAFPTLSDGSQSVGTNKLELKVSRNYVTPMNIDSR